MSDPSLFERVQGGTVFVMRGWIPAITVEKNQIKIKTIKINDSD